MVLFSKEYSERSDFAERKYFNEGRLNIISDKYKKLILAIVIVMCIILLLSACGTRRNIDFIDDNKIVLDKNEVKQINITTNGFTLPQNINITNEEQIFTVTDYLTALDINKSNMYQEEYIGQSFEFEILLKDNSGGRFILGDEEFAELLVNICEGNQSKNGEPSIEGIIVSIKKDENGKDISCVIRDKNSLDHNIYVKNAA